MIPLTFLPSALTLLAASTIHLAPPAQPAAPIDQAARVTAAAAVAPQATSSQEHTLEAAGPAAAGPSSRFHYDYVGVGLSLGDFTGVAADLSFDLQDSWLLVGNLSHLSKSRVDFTSISLGAGYMYPLLDRLDLIGTAELEHGRFNDSRPGRSSKTELGARVRFGARFEIKERLEAFGGVGARTIFKNDFRRDIGILYALTEAVSLVGKVEVDDATQVVLGARFLF